MKMDAGDAPFLVARLGVKVLPCVIAFVDGVGRERVVGFEGLRGGDGCGTGELERRFVGKGVLEEGDGEGEGLEGLGGRDKERGKDEGGGGDGDDDEWD